MGTINKLGPIGTLFTLPLQMARRQKEQWLPEAELRTLRAQRTRALLETARSAPYYRRLLADLTSSAAAAAFHELPFLDKKILRENGEESFLTEGGEGLLPVFTSGSTGQPTRFLRSPAEEAEFSARWYRIYSAYGGKPRDTLLNVGRPDAKPRSGPAKMLRDVGLLPKVCHTSVTDPIEESVQIVRDFQPHFVTGYAIGIENIAAHIVEQNIELNSPKAVLCGAMDVTDRCRDLVHRAFSAPAVNVYVSNEFGVVGWECPERHGSLHVNEDMLVMEIVDGDGRPVADGTPGEIVLTSLTLSRMPLIRYRTGDTAARIAGSCTCGRGLALMTPVQGRTSHTIFGPEGQLITAPVVANAVSRANGYQWVRRFQLREEENGVLALLVEPHCEADASQIDNLVSAMAAVVGPSYRIRLELRDCLPLAPTGKYQYVIPLAPPTPAAAGGVTAGSAVASPVKDPG